MLCYICLEKRSDYIKKYINWTLFNDNEILVKYEDIECEFNNNILVFNEKNTINTIDINNKIYIRETNEFTFKIDFKNKEFEYILKEKDLKIKDKLKSASFENSKDIILIYNLDEEEKKIIINLL